MIDSETRTEPPATAAGVDATASIERVRCMYAQAWPPRIIAYLTDSTVENIAELAHRDLERPGVVDPALETAIANIAACVEGARGTVIDNAVRRGLPVLAARLRQVAPYRFMRGPDEETAQYAEQRGWKNFAELESAKEASDAVQEAIEETAQEAEREKAAGARPASWEEDLAAVRLQTLTANAALWLQVLDDSAAGIKVKDISENRGLSARKVTDIRISVGFAVRFGKDGRVIGTPEQQARAEFIVQTLQEWKQGERNALEAAHVLGMALNARGFKERYDEAREQTRVNRASLAIQVLRDTLAGLSIKEVSEKRDVERRQVSRIRKTAGLSVQVLPGLKIAPVPGTEERFAEIKAAFADLDGERATVMETAIRLGVGVNERDRRPRKPLDTPEDVEEPTEKTCTWCQVTKPIRAFPFISQERGRRSNCQPCHRESQKRHRRDQQERGAANLRLTSVS